MRDLVKDYQEILIDMRLSDDARALDWADRLDFIESRQTEYYNLKEVAKLLGYKSLQIVYNSMSQGTFPLKSYKYLGKRVVSKVVLHRYLEYGLEDKAIASQDQMEKRIVRKRETRAVNREVKYQDRRERRIKRIREQVRNKR